MLSNLIGANLHTSEMTKQTTDLMKAIECLHNCMASYVEKVIGIEKHGQGTV